MTKPLIRRVQAEHKDMISKLCIERDIPYQFYTIENDEAFLQLELTLNDDNTLWFIGMAYGMAIYDEIYKSVYKNE
jgi:hypothetical protein